MISILIWINLFMISSASNEASELDLKPSFSYITFHSSINDNISPLVFENTKMFILAKRCNSAYILVLNSAEYVFLERDFEDLNHITYEKRNYNIKAPLLFEGFNVHGYTVIKDELTHVVVTDSSNNLYVLTIDIQSTPRYFEINI